ncbi:MAG: delta-60 repeat domain-containing protein [Opitutaceae bacterium]|nr:delta-60 repeat domain-containing protein [Opitutaceae bacterium]
MHRLLTVLIVGALTGAIRPDARGQAWTRDPSVAAEFVHEYSVLAGASFVPLPDGDMIALGGFSRVNGGAASKLARLRADGTLDRTFTAELAADESVSAVAPLSQRRLLVVVNNRSIVAPPPPITPLSTVVLPPMVNPGTSDGGSMPPMPLTSTARLIRLHADGRKDTTFTPLPIAGVTNLTLLADGRIALWGYAGSIAGVAVNGLARLNADGTFDSSYAPALSSTPLYINAVAATLDGGLVVSGVSTAAAATAPRFVLARLFANGQVDARFSPVNVRTTYTLLSSQPDGGVLAGNGSLARYLPSGALDTTYRVQIPALKSIVRIAALPNGRLAVEARVGPNMFGAPVVFTVTADGALERDLRRATGAGEGQLLRAAFADGRLLILQGALITTGYFGVMPADTPIITGPPVTTTGTPSDSSVAMPIAIGPSLYAPSLALGSADTATIAGLGTTLTEESPGSVLQIEIDSSDRVLVHGTFSQVNGQPRSGLARFLPSGALDSSFVPAGDGLVFAPPDGRPIVHRTVLGPKTTDGFHPLITEIVRLKADGSVDPNFTFPTGFDAANTRWLAAASDGRFLISTFAPGNTAETNLKLVWLAADGRPVATLPTKFSGFTRIYPVPLMTTPTNGTVEPPPATTPIPVPPYYTGLPNPIDAVRIVAGQQLLVAGGFMRVNDLVRPTLVRLNPDGSVDPSYVPPVPATDPPRVITPPVAVDPTTPAVPVMRLPGLGVPLADGRAILFTYEYLNWRLENRVVRLQTNGAVDPTFRADPGIRMGDLRELRDGSLFAWGRHYTADGVLDRNFAPRVFGSIQTAAMDGAGALWVGGYFDQIDGRLFNALARFTSSEIAGITFGPVSQKIVAGRSVSFDVVIGTNRPATYQWTRNGTTLTGATAATFTIPHVTTANAGSYRVAVTIGSQAFVSEPALLTVLPGTGRLINFSARCIVGPATPQFAGLVCANTAPRLVLVRAVGRGLPMTDTITLPAPVLTLYDAGREIAQNRGGGSHLAIAALARAVGAFPILASSTASALARDFTAGAFTAVTTSGDGSSGMSLLEFYDAGGDTASALIRNFSIRGRTAPGSDFLTAGIVIDGNGPLQLLIRGIGPSLANFGVAGGIPDPVLQVFDGTSEPPLAISLGHDAEVSAAAASVSAFSLAEGSRDAGVVVWLEPGAYIAQLGSASGVAGEGMIEFYVLEP